MAVAACIFDPQTANTSVSKEETIKVLEHLRSTFNIDKQCAVGERNIFASFLAKHSESCE